MRLRPHHFAGAVAILLAASPAMAQTSDQTGSSDSQPSSSSSFTPPDGCDPEVADYLRTASERGIQDEIHRGQYPFSQPQSVSSLACLDNLLNTNFNLLYGFPSLDSLLGQLANRVCSAASSMWAQTGGARLYQLNSEIYNVTNPTLNLPEIGTVSNTQGSVGLPNFGTGSTAGSPGGISGPNVTPAAPQNSSGFMNQIGNLFGGK